MKEKLLINLDAEQKLACMAPFKPTLVKAVAGSGKTRTLTHRVAYTIASGVPAEEILLLTFTNKASREMMKRIKEILDTNEVFVTGGTFHSIGSKLLRKHAHRIGYNQNFSIIDPDESQNLINRRLNAFLKGRELGKKDFPNKKIIYNLYSSSINLNTPIEELADNFTEFEIESMKEIIEHYRKDKMKYNLMDFDDLIVNFLEILKLEEVRKVLSRKFKYILCDEYQDINHIQNDILKLLDKGNENIFVVGDPNQSIYHWRGGNVSFIENFSSEYNDAQSFNITHNYRSVAPILSLAERSINKNYSVPSVKITPFIKGGTKPFYKEFSSREHINFIVEKIKEYHSAGIEYGEIAILLRTNFLSNTLEREFKINRIPYQLIAGFSFFERQHVKDILAFLNIESNPTDVTSYMRALSLFEGVGEASVKKIIEHLQTYMYQPEALKLMSLSKKAQSSFNTFIELMDGVKREKSIEDKITYILEYFYDNYMRVTFEDCDSRKEDLMFMVEMSERYSTLADFIDDMTLSVESDSVLSNDGVVITTYHKSKGLEWDVVFMPFIGTLPYKKTEIKEERRLFYVGVTRARKQLFITHTDTMPFTGNFIEESEFIKELDFDDCFDGDELGDIDF